MAAERTQMKDAGGEMLLAMPTERLTNLCGGDGGVASAGLRAQRRNIDPRSRRLAGHRPDGWPSLDGGSV